MGINWIEVTPKCEAHLKEIVQPILDKHGATLVRRCFNDYDYVQGIIVIGFRGEEIGVGTNEFQREKHIEWFLANFDQVREIANNFTRPNGNLSPFHSDIYRYFRAKWGERHGQRPIRAKGEVHSYQDCVLFLAGATWPYCQERQIASNVKIVRLSPTSIAVRLYNTNIIVYHAGPPYMFEADNGGFNTYTTSARANQFGPIGCRFYHYKKKLCVTNVNGQMTGPGILLRCPDQQVPFP